MIVYAMICRAKDAAVLAESSSPQLSGNAPQVTVALMEHLRDHPNVFQDGDMKTLVHRNDEADDFFSDFMVLCAMSIDTSEVEENYFHLYLKDGLFYCCLADDPGVREQKVNCAFLQNLQEEFTKQFWKSRIKSANAYAMDKAFAPTFRTTMHYYNINQSKLARDDKVTALMAQVEDMTVVMDRNINLLFQRGGNLENMLRKSEDMEEDCKVFKRKARTVKKRKQRKFYRVYAVLVLLILSIFYIVMAAACGWQLNCSRRWNN